MLISSDTEDIFCTCCNNFDNITEFCFTCLHFHDDKCNICNSTHEKKVFSNKHQDWKSEERIKYLLGEFYESNDLFKDITEVLNIRDEKVDNVESEHIYTDDFHNWKCPKCEVENNCKNKICEICNIGRNSLKKNNSQIIETTSNTVIKNLINLDDIGSPIMEYICHMFYKSGSNSSDTYKARNVIEYQNQLPTNSLWQLCVTNRKSRDDEEQLQKDYYNIINQVMDSVKFFYPSDKWSNIMTNKKQTMHHDFNVINQSISVPSSIKPPVEIDENKVWEEIKNLPNLIQLPNSTKRKLMVELNIKDDEKISLLWYLMKDKRTKEVIDDQLERKVLKLRFVRELLVIHSIIDDIYHDLHKLCELCCDYYPAELMKTLLTCTHEMCNNCFRSTYVEAIIQKNPDQWICPSCPPDYLNDIDQRLHYNHIKSLLIKEKENKEMEIDNLNDLDSAIKLFDVKLLDSNLRTNNEFRWCPYDTCQNGFEVANADRIICPSCKQYLCGKCNRKWDDRHEGISCLEFEMLMIHFDPALETMLNEIGIQCPKCNMRYEVAAGGCLHFDCRKCDCKFCGGCSGVFVKECGVAQCSMTDFHAHHPRNCLYYLRDFAVDALLAMLKDCEFSKKTLKDTKKCVIKKVDENYNSIDCPDPIYNNTGYCQSHYKEYLIQIINMNLKDPADFTKEENALNLMIMQSKRAVLEKSKNETKDQFIIRLKKEIKENCLPLYVPKAARGKVAQPQIMD